MVTPSASRRGLKITLSNAFIVSAYPHVLPGRAHISSMPTQEIRDEASGKLKVGLDNQLERVYIPRPTYWMIYIAVNQQVTMRANYLYSQLMTNQGQSATATLGCELRVLSGPGRERTPRSATLTCSRVFSMHCAQSFCPDWVHTRPAGNREVYMI
jgi:hypothetical protein